jgi:hypothetical protein
MKNTNHITVPNERTRLPILCAATAAVMISATSARADITYVDAREGASGNTYASGGSLEDTSWIDLTTNTATSDNSNWMIRFGGSPGFSEHNGGDVIQGLVSEYPNELGEITTEVTDLPDGVYNVWVFFWEQTVSTTQNWVIDAGLTSGSLASYSSPVGPVASTDSTTAVAASSLTFSNSPSVVAAGGNQGMYGVNLGSIPVSGGSSINVYVDKLVGVGSNIRTIYDGIGYEYVGPLTPPALVSTDPVDDAPAVLLSQNLAVNFDLPIQPGASGNIEIKRSSDNSTVEVLSVNDIAPPGTVTFSGNTVTIDPTSDLVGGTEYYVLIDSNAIESSVGIAFSGITAAGDWSFTADGTPPSLTAMVPMAGTVAAQPGTDLRLNFNEDVVTVAGKFITIYQADNTLVEAIDVSDSVTSGGQLTLPVSVSLTLGTSYYVTVEVGAFVDLSGNPYGGIAGSSAWTFTTALSDITYIDAIEGASGNTFATGGSLADVSWIENPGSTGTNETQWNLRTEVEGNSSALFQALHEVAISDEMPELTTQITGLADGTYAIWAFYWDQIDSNSQNWTLSAGLTSGSLSSYSSPGEPAIEGATTINVFNAADLVFTNSVDVEAGFNGSIYLRNLFGVHVGNVTVSGGSSTVDVFIDNLIGNTSNNRTWYDGVGYQLVSTSTAVADPKLTSLTSLGGGNWEVILEGDPNTAYEFRSSTTLSFTPGNLVQPLTQGNPGSDPGSISVASDRVTTDGSGNATVRMNLGSAPANFVRAQTTP